MWGFSDLIGNYANKSRKGRIKYLSCLRVLIPRSVPNLMILFLFVVSSWIRVRNWILYKHHYFISSVKETDISVHLQSDFWFSTSYVRSSVLPWSWHLHWNIRNSLKLNVNHGNNPFNNNFNNIDKRVSLKPFEMKYKYANKTFIMLRPSDLDKTACCAHFVQV